jgi:hypothetical protein
MKNKGDEWQKGVEKELCDFFFQTQNVIQFLKCVFENCIMKKLRNKNNFSYRMWKIFTFFLQFKIFFRLRSLQLWLLFFSKYTNPFQNPYIGLSPVLLMGVLFWKYGIILWNISKENVVTRNISFELRNNVFNTATNRSAAQANVAKENSVDRYPVVLLTSHKLGTLEVSWHVHGGCERSTGDAYSP